MNYVWRTLFQRKVRTGLSMLGVSVSVAGIVALISVAHGLRGSVDRYMESSGASLLVFSRNAGDLIFSTVRKEEIERIRTIEGVSDLSRVNFYVVRPKDVKFVPAIFCFGRHPEEPIMRKYERFLVDGQLLRGPDELLASRFLAEGMGWKVGSKVSLMDREFEVVGTFESDISWENGGVLLHASVVAKWLGREDSYTLLFVHSSEEDRPLVRKHIEEAFPHLLAIPPAEFTQSFDDQLAIVDEFILIVTAIALVVGVLGVLNTMMMSVSERTREIGTLRALGWSRRRVLATVLSEGVMLSCVGGGLGLLFGVAGTEALIRLFETAYLVADYRPLTFVYGGLVGLVVGVVAAAYPALRAANLRPVEALRYE